MDDKELDRLCEIIGSLVIDQFDTQEEYREVINMIFHAVSYTHLRAHET